MAIMVRKGQTVEITDDYNTLEGYALRDWDDEGEDLFYMQDGFDGTVLKVRIDLATSFIVDGVEIINQL